MTIYHVAAKYYNNGRVSVSFYTLELDHKPENTFKETAVYDIYNDYFTNKKEAEQFYNDTKHA